MIENNKLETQKLKQKEAQDMISAKKVNRRSENLFDRKKQKKFEEIFKLLDSDADGIIDSQNIDIDTINPDVLQIINELLVEMEEKGKSLETSSFVSGMNKYYEWLNPSDRQNLMSLSVIPKSEISQVEQKPKINEFSNQIVENLRKRDDGLNNIKQKWSERRKEYMDLQTKKEKDEDELLKKGPSLNRRDLFKPKPGNSIKDLFNPLRIKD